MVSIIFLPFFISFSFFFFSFFPAQFFLWIFLSSTYCSFNTFVFPHPSLPAASAVFWTLLVLPFMLPRICVSSAVCLSTHMVMFSMGERIFFWILSYKFILDSARRCSRFAVSNTISAKRLVPGNSFAMSQPTREKCQISEQGHIHDQ